MNDHARTCWAEGMGLSPAAVEALSGVADEAKARGLAVDLPPGDVWAAWPIELTDAGAEDLADRVSDLEAAEGP